MPDPNRLRAFIKELGLTQEEFAQRIGFGRERVSRAVAGSVPADELFIGKFFIAFGADATERVFGSPTTEQPA